MRRQLGIAHRVLDVPVPEVVLQGAGIVAVVGQLVVASAALATPGRVTSISRTAQSQSEGAVSGAKAADNVPSGVAGFSDRSQGFACRGAIVQPCKIVVAGPKSVSDMEAERAIRLELLFREELIACRLVGEIMANRIIEEASSGERDPEQLCAWAIIQAGDSGGSNIET